MAFVLTDSRVRSLCGGTLIAPTYVLTARTVSWHRAAVTVVRKADPTKILRVAHGKEVHPGT